MALVLGINSYGTIEEADLYFETRIDVAAWESADDDLKEQSLVSATNYLDTFAYTGYITDTEQSLLWPRVGNIFDDRTGRNVSFKSKYEWEELDTTSSENFTRALYKLPLEIRLIKIALYEQSYHLINNDGVLDSTGGLPDSIRVGDITIDGLAGNSTVPTRSNDTRRFIKPLLLRGGANTWYRAN